MSRIGKQPIKISEGVDVRIEGNLIHIKGSKGELEHRFRPELKVEKKDGEILVSIFKKTKKSPALWGLTRNLIFNMVKGVSEGYEKVLEMRGIGYRASLEGENLLMNLGFSHPVKLTPPTGIKFKIDGNFIIISGVDKQKVGEVSANIRKIKKPEPYKGKGIRYKGEVVRKKSGKKAATAGG